MSLRYSHIQVFTSEEVRWKGRSICDAIAGHVAAAKIAARCIATRGFAGCYESGELASDQIEVLTFNMPVRIEIILPAAELEAVLPGIQEMVTDGIVLVSDAEVALHRTRRRLIPRQIKVKDAMTASPKSVTAETPVSDVIRLLLGSDFNAVPVVDASARPIGVITQGDLISRAGMPIRLGLLSQFGREKLDEYLETLVGRTAGEIMTKLVVTVQEDKRLSDAVERMLKGNLKRLPVVNSEGVLVGMLARVDVFRAITRETPDWAAMGREKIDVESARLVRDIMRRDTHTVLPDAPIEEVIRMIDTSDIQRLAVVDAAGRLLGLISDKDVFGAFAERRAGLWEYFTRRRAPEVLGGAGVARDVMKKDLVTVEEDTPIEEAIGLMAEKGLKRLPVVDEAGIFRGMVSRDSLLRAGLVI